MNTKKLLGDTVGIVVGGVAMGEANKLGTVGKATSTMIGVGILGEVSKGYADKKKKKSGGLI